MSEALYEFIKDFERDLHALYSYHNVTNEWPAGELERMVSAGLLRQIESTEMVECTECWDLEEVVYLENPSTGETMVYVKCFQCGSYRVPEEWVHQWQSDCRELIPILKSKIGASGPSRELTVGRIWSLGKARLAEANRNVYFGRALFEQDTWRIFNETKMSSRSVLLAPEFVPKFDARFESTPIVIPLASALSWREDELQFDLDFVEAEVADRAPSESADKPKSGRRLSTVERLIREIDEHLIAARDYAFTEKRRHGEPKLLPRPSREFLARKLGVDKSTVTRAFKSSRARELNYYWELALDIYRVMEHKSARTKSCTK